ncbi:SGNH/GDSL hydrolase family protein [Streptomyces zagrosensis]|uniref:triacylglycerol lipase n=1 Tax=Streptomyces zagrosensis TaxID=1042984 RepID=A0A7W9QBS3_9ACTN|nr:SGNH/GDSL hydrolase family protein [Streptomyces zagrosensis]MBB5936312.1 lysophospholipase L1-like esterase [Streptomyces zagrosensis]
MRLTRFLSAASAALLTAALALTGGQVAQAADATAQDRANTQAASAYVALGDSYSSGVGAGDYDASSGDCKRSNRAYPKLWANKNAPSSFNFTACSGARTGDVLANQLGPVNSGTGLVSITIGGNDAGFADVMTTCVLQSESACVNRINTARAYVESTLPGKLDQVYSAIDSRAPSARVVVLGYPRFYQLNGSCVAGLTEKERTAINNAADLLNTTIAKRAADHGFAFGDIASRFAGHEICSSNSWLHSVTFPIGDSYHPTAAGQSGGYLPSFAAAA